MSDEYTRVGEEERKPLTDYHDEAETDVQTAAEIYALKRTIKRTNLYLKVLIGLLSVTILALLSLQGPTVYKTIKETKDKPKDTTTPRPKQLIKTPVPDSKMPCFLSTGLHMLTASQFLCRRLCLKRTNSTPSVPTQKPTQHGMPSFP